MAACQRARDWFETIRANVADMIGLETEIEVIETRTGPSGQQVGSIGGGGGGHDAMSGIDHLVDTGARERLRLMREKVDPMVEEATAVLYGKSGRGGLAKAKGSVDADILCGYYLQGMGWPAIAAAYAMPGAKSPNTWCRMRARRALAYIDRIGAHVLADS